MTTLSSTAWIAHNLGLAASIGGTLFGQQALKPALEERLGDPQEQRLVADAAWRKFGWVNLAAHGLFAVTWFAGRRMLSGYEVSSRARKMTLMKDGLVIASLVTGIASTIIGRVLGKKTREMEARRSSDNEMQIERLRKIVGAVGMVNLISTASVIGVTTALAMEGNRSLPFSVISRRLP